MQGFKAFILRGNLIELAVAFVIGAAFAALVTAFTDVIVELLAKAGGSPNFDKFQPGGLMKVGPFLTALVAFLLMAAIVYFLIVTPYEKAKERRSPAKEDAPEGPDEVALLVEIRDLLSKSGTGGTPGV